MTRPTNTFSTFEAIGQREDLKDIIANISPTDCPFQRLAGKADADNTYTEWQTDSLASASTANAQIEADDYAGTAVSPTVRIGNRTQISAKAPIVSGTLEAVKRAGRSKEMAYQVVKMTKELRRDMEAIMTQNQASTAGNATTARKLGSLEAIFSTNVSRGAGGASGGFSASNWTAATDGTQRAFTEALLKSTWATCFSAGGDPDTLMTGPVQKQNVSTFTGGSTRTDKSEDRRVTATVDVYVSDFGSCRVIANRFSRNRTAFGLQSSFWNIAFLRPVQQQDLAQTGDAKKKLITVEYTIQAKNEGSSFVVADLT